MRCLYFTSRWPLRNYSAGHERIYSLIGSLVQQRYSVSVLCEEEATEANTKEIRSFPVEIVECVGGRLPKLQSHKIAIFDTYLTANRFSEDLYNRYNKTIQILDLQDRHALRQGRQARYQQWVKRQPSVLLPKGEPMWTPQPLEEQEQAINKADLVVTCSDFEHYNMRNTPANNVCLASFLYPTKSLSKELTDHMYRPYNLRRNFVFVGNMLHRPNIDAVKVLLQHIWPAFRKENTKHQLHIYGSEFPAELMQARGQLKDKGIRLMGQMTDTEQIGKYIAMLAPLRFGAGVKGKIIDSWMQHTPVITTPIGSQGMFLQSVDEALMSDKSIYYSDKTQLTEQQQSSQTRLHSYYQRNSFLPPQQPLKFGGLWQNYTSEQFTQSILQLTRNRPLWDRLRQVGASTIIKNHSERVGQKGLFGSLTSTELRLKLLRNRPSYRHQWEQQRFSRRARH